MAIEIQEIDVDRLAEYARVLIVFEVNSVLQVYPMEGGPGGLRLCEERVVSPYVKDYDGYEDGGPERWPEQFDLRNWGIFLAMDGARSVGGSTVAFDTPGVHMLAGRRDLAALWDIRVDPGDRRRGIGAALFAHAADWARTKGCTQMSVETQNVNVPGCRFYASQGCHLGQINRYAYAGHPEVGHETMLVWYLDL